MFTAISIDTGENNPSKCQAPSGLVEAVVEHGLHYGVAGDEPGGVDTQVSDAVDNSDHRQK